MPAIEYGGHLVRYLFEAGPGVDGKAIGYADLAAWCSHTGVELQEFEAVTLIDLAREYMGWLSKSVDQATPPPYREELPTPEELAEKIKAAFRSFRRKR